MQTHRITNPFLEFLLAQQEQQGFSSSRKMSLAMGYAYDAVARYISVARDVRSARPVSDLFCQRFADLAGVDMTCLVALVKESGLSLTGEGKKGRNSDAPLIPALVRTRTGCAGCFTQNLASLQCLGLAPRGELPEKVFLGPICAALPGRVPVLCESIDRNDIFAVSEAVFAMNGGYNET